MPLAFNPALFSFNLWRETIKALITAITAKISPYLEGLNVSVSFYIHELVHSESGILNK